MCISFLLIFTAVSFSQTNLSELQKQLPNTVQDNPGLLKQITQTLERDISLNPDLVAYRVNYYKKLFNEGVKDNELNGLNNLRMQTVEYYQNKNRWIEKEKQRINNSSYSPFYKSKAIEFISEYYSEIIDTNIKAVYDLNPNYVDYFSAIALGTNNLGDYNPSIDYTKSKKAIEKVIKDSQIEKLESIVNDVEVIEPLENILNYWYLFPNDGYKNEFVLSEIILKYYQSEHCLTGFLSNEILFGINFFQIKEEIDIKSSGSIIPNDQILGDVKNATQFNLSFNHKIFLADNLTPFSFITLGAGVGVSLDAKTEIKDNLIVYQKDPLPNNGFISQTWNASEIIFKDPFRAAVFLKGNTPVLFFNRNIFIQLGFVSGINLTSYKLQYRYSYDKVQVVWDENQQRFISTLLERKIGEQAAEENSKSKFFVYPTVDLSLFSFTPILFQVSAGYNFVSAKIGYGF
jgi:hypothetical protein